jgi:DNA uptake protein ComE-like DNA-binding protein
MKNPPEPDEWARVLPYFDLIQLDKLPDSVFIYVNREEKETLGRHPYIGYSLAERIVNYRLHHGKFVSLESLSKIYGVKPGTWEKLRLYIRYE